ncbi:MAG: hypothetical protein IID61_08900 [SAR324 cluster bacterium]|nr:hypothetical protein [SAR324 cluster bacterium]
MAEHSKDKRFLKNQIEAIRRFQRVRAPKSPEEAQRLALEWINRFAGSARSRWYGRGPSGPTTNDYGHKAAGSWKT